METVDAVLKVSQTAYNDMVYVPPSRPSIRIIRNSPFKGGTRQWSQRFFWTGANFTTAQFNVMCDTLRDLLKAITLTESSLVEYIGYDIGSDVPVFTRTVTTAGTYPIGSNPVMPLETAALVRLTTTQRSVKNHPIYGFKYFHNVQNDGGSDHEKLRVGWKSTCAGQIDTLLAGISDGSGTRSWCDAKGAVFQTRTVSDELTHRDFPNL